MALGTGKDWSNVDFHTICKCSNALFGEFSKRFSTLNLSSLSEQAGQDGSSLGAPTSMQELLLLLRYCIGIVKFLVDDPRPAIKGTESLLEEKSKYLLQVLQGLCSSDKLIQKGEDVVSFECSVSATSCFVRPDNQCIPFLCRMLEVFADELLAHEALREYFLVLDSVSSTGNNLFTSWDTTTNCMLELMSNHCLLSFSAVTDCGDFSEILSWVHKSEEILSTPQISLNVAMSLLSDPVMISAPKLLHAHVISLCCEVIGFTNCDMPGDMDKKLRLNCYLSTFEGSVNLYIRLMAHLLDDDVSADDRSLISDRKNLHLPFESFISSSTNDRINHILSKFDKLWALHACTLPMKTKSDIVTSATACVIENSHLIDEQCRNDAISYLSCLIEKEFSIGSMDTTLIRNCEKDLQQVCLLCATLKLMHCSMLQAFWSIKRIKDPSHFKTSTDSSLLEGYKFLLGLIQYFGQHKIGLEIEKLFVSAIQTQLWRHKELKLMFVHFTGLLALSLARGLHILVNECMLVMIALINLLIVEEGSLDFLGHMLGSGVEHLAGNHASNDGGSDIIGETLERTTKESKYRRSSLKVASKFQEIKMMHARGTSVSGDGIAATKESQEICNGEIFLACVGDDIDDDLADFIECKEGRDYSIWLKARQRHQRWRRKWLQKKRTVQRSLERRKIRDLLGPVWPTSCQKPAPVSSSRTRTRR